jgi:hypothetical protein
MIKQVLKNPIVQVELGTNVISFAVSLITSALCVGTTVGTIIMTVADSIPTWIILVLREWHTGRGFI